MKQVVSVYEKMCLCRDCVKDEGRSCLRLFTNTFCSKEKNFSLKLKEVQVAPLTFIVTEKGRFCLLVLFSKSPHFV